MVAADRERLLAEQLFLWEHRLMQALLFDEDEPGQVWVEQGRTEDHAEVLEIWRYWGANIQATQRGFEVDWDLEQRFLEVILDYPGLRLQIARDRDGRVVGFTTVLPLCRESLGLLDLNPGVRPLPYAFFDDADLAALAPTAESARAFCLLHVGDRGWRPAEVNAALFRGYLGVLALGGVYFCSTPFPLYKSGLAALGFELVPKARNLHWGAANPVDGYVLDLRQLGVEAWLESLMGGSQPGAEPETSPPDGTGGVTGRRSNAGGPLTRREREIAALIARGLTNRQIADELVLSVRTVERHVENLYDKLGVSGRAARAAVAAFAAREGLAAPR